MLHSCSRQLWDTVNTTYISFLNFPMIIHHKRNKRSVIVWELRAVTVAKAGRCNCTPARVMQSWETLFPSLCWRVNNLRTTTDKNKTIPMTVLREGRDTLSPIHALQGTGKRLVARDSDLHSSGSQAVASTVDFSWPAGTSPGLWPDIHSTAGCGTEQSLPTHCWRYVPAPTFIPSRVP